MATKVSKNKENLPNFTLDSYKQTNKMAREIKNKLNTNIDPINQKSDKYKPHTLRKSKLTEEYNKRMNEKKEKLSIKRIPQKDNLGTDFSINQPLNNKFHIKFFNTYRNQQSEEKPYKHLKRKIYEKDNMKNFYSDNFNTNKLNENDKNLIKVNVRNKLYNKI